MDTYIKKYMEKHKFGYINISNNNDLNIIYDLYKNNNIIDNNLSGVVLLYYGVYYRIHKNYDLMKKYYLMAIEMGNSNAMNNLAVHYETVEINYDLMKKYYLMAIDNGSLSAMDKLMLYYNDCINKNELNDALVFFNKYAYLDKKYIIIQRMFMYNYNFNNYYIINDYVLSINIQHCIIKYKNTIVKHKIIYINYNKIFNFLTCIVNKNIPKNIKILIIYNIIIDYYI